MAYAFPFAAGYSIQFLAMLAVVHGYCRSLIWADIRFAPPLRWVKWLFASSAFALIAVAAVILPTLSIWLVGDVFGYWVAVGWVYAIGQLVDLVAVFIAIIPYRARLKAAGYWR